MADERLALNLFRGEIAVAGRFPDVIEPIVI